MLQWMGGSRKKVNASRKSMHHKQKHYFEQRKRLQRTIEAESFNDVNGRQVQCHEGSRSLDIQSFVNLATVAQRATQPETLSPDKSSAATVFKNAPATQNISSKVEDLRLPASSYDVGSNITSFKSQEKQEDFKDEILVLDLLDDDNKEINWSKRNAVPETHVSFSVSGLGKIGMETPAQSPRTQIRSFPSPPRVIRHMHKSRNTSRSNIHMPYDLGIESSGDVYDTKKTIDEDAAEVICKRKSTNYEKRNRKSMKFIDSYRESDLLDLSGCFGDCNGSFQDSRRELWESRNDLLDNDFSGTREYDAEWDHKLSYSSRASFRSNAKMTEKHDYSFGSFSSDTSRYGATQQKKSGNSANEDHSFGFSASAKEFNFAGKDRSVFNFPSWSFTQKDYLPDSASSLSEESCSSTAAREDKSYDFHSHSAKIKESKKSHLDELDMSLPNLGKIKKNCMDELEKRLGQGNYKCMSKQPDIKECHRSKISPAVNGTSDLDSIFSLSEEFSSEFTQGKCGSNIPVGHRNYFELESGFGNNTSSDRSNFMLQSKKPHTDTFMTEGFLPYSFASGDEQNDIQIADSVGHTHFVDNRDIGSTSTKLENEILRNPLFSENGRENSKETASECQEPYKRTQKASSGDKANAPLEEAEEPPRKQVSALQTYISNKVELLDCSSPDPSEITTKGSIEEKLGPEVTIFESIAGKDFFKQGAEATMKFNSVHIHLLHKQFVWQLTK